MRSNVVLPAPFGPTRPWTLPAATSTSSPSIARTSPNAFCRLRTPRARSTVISTPDREDAEREASRRPADRPLYLRRTHGRRPRVPTTTEPLPPCRARRAPAGSTLAVEFADPFLQPGKMLRVVIRTRLADPAIRLGGPLGQRTPGLEHPGPRGDRLRPHVAVRNVVHQVEELLIHRVDLDLLCPVRAGTDALEDHARLGEPTADVADQILRRPAFREVPRLVDLVVREAVDQRAELRPEPVLLREERTIRDRLRHRGSIRRVRPRRQTWAVREWLLPPPGR